MPCPCHADAIGEKEKAVGKVRTMGSSGFFVSFTLVSVRASSIGSGVAEGGGWIDR